MLRQLHVWGNFEYPSSSPWAPAAVDEEASGIRALVDPEK